MQIAMVVMWSAIDTRDEIPDQVDKGNIAAIGEDAHRLVEPPTSLKPLGGSCCSRPVSFIVAGGNRFGAFRL